MRRLIPILIFVTACTTSGSSDTSTSTPTNPTVVASQATSSTTSTLSTPSTTFETEIAWTDVEAERIVENYLAALAAGAWDVAAFSADNNGIQIQGSDPGETNAQTLERFCRGGACEGPYGVQAQGPGIVNPSTGQAASTVQVTHGASGAVAFLNLFTFEGQQIVAGLPPLEQSPDSGAIVNDLFGDRPPDSVVVERFSGFEAWVDGSPHWVVNWWAKDTYAIERQVAFVSHPFTSTLLATPIDDPLTTYEPGCSQPLERNGSVFTLDDCVDPDKWTMIDVVTGDADSPLIPPPEPAPESGYSWMEERGGSAFIAVGDAEGNLVSIVNSDGIDLLNDGYAGFTRISANGETLLYVDHADAAAYSHFFSPVVVAVDFASGSELGRWEFDGPVLCLEADTDWVVACLGDSPGPEPNQIALVAINLSSGDQNIVQTRSRLFLPG